MILNIVIGLMCSVASSTVASPLPKANTVIADSFWDGPVKKGVMVKRETFEDRPDRQLKQVSLSSLVENLEKNLFASALSLNKVLTDPHATVLEIKADNKSHDVATKSQMVLNEEDNRETANTVATAKRETIISLPKTTDSTVILQTTEKVQQTVGAPTHIIIDRIAIQPHTGEVASIPIFDTTKFSASITGLATASTESSINTFSSSTTATTEDTIVTTPINIEQLKEAEEELKETLAEIEAEPIILSARV